MNASTRYRFDGFTLDVGTHELLRGVETEETIALSKLSFRLLCALVEAAPNVVTHDELAARIWGPHRIVTPENLAKRVMLLRRALGDQARAPRYIVGVRGVGYRLVVHVHVNRKTDAAREARETTPEANAEDGAADRQARRPLLRRMLRYVAAGLSIAVLAVAIAAAIVEEPEARGEEAAPRVAVAPDESLASPGVNSVRINVELRDAETESLIWADSYEAELAAEDIGGMKTGIASSIASGLAEVASAEPRAVATSDDLAAVAPDALDATRPEDPAASAAADIVPM